MPRYPVERSTNFIVEDESWSVVEYDHTSVPGIIYLSLTENKINLIYDDLDINLADTDKLAEYKLATPLDTQIFTVGEAINPTFTLTKNGIPISLDVELVPTDKTIVRIVNGQLTAVNEGETEIIVKVKDYPQIQQSLPIKVAGTSDQFSAYIEGVSMIRLDRDAIYELKGTDILSDTVNYFVDTDLVKIIDVKDNKCTIHANDKNQLGTFILTATYKDISYTKTIQIVPLW